MNWVVYYDFRTKTQIIDYPLQIPDPSEQDTIELLTAPREIVVSEFPERLFGEDPRNLQRVCGKLDIKFLSYGSFDVKSFASYMDCEEDLLPRYTGHNEEIEQLTPEEDGSKCLRLLDSLKYSVFILFFFNSIDSCECPTWREYDLHSERWHSSFWNCI